MARTEGGHAPGEDVAGNAVARTPEELEMLFEDVLITRDNEALARLFEEGAVLVTRNGRPTRGGAEIANVALDALDGDHTYIADPQQVMQARDIALIIAPQGINVLRRGSDGAWRYAIVLFSVNDPGEEQ